MSYRTEEFNKLNSVFTDSASNLLDTNGSINELQQVLDDYNALIIYAEIGWERKHKSTKQHITYVIEANRTILQRCFAKLNLPTILPSKLLSHIHYLPPPNTDSSARKQTDSEIQTDTILTQNIQTQTTMAQSKSDFLKLASGLINYKFEGDPLKLASFLADVDLVEESAEENNAALCLTFIKRCISGRALEFIPDDANTIARVKKALNDNIKPESSDVVEGKMMALKVRKGNFTEFTQEAEKLAEAFRRSLVVSGISQAKAQEMTIKKTIELCRKTTRSEVVKSVIASSRYEQPADVLATLVTQTDISKKEKAENDAFKSRQQSKNSNVQNQNNRSNQRGSGRGNFSQYVNRNSNGFRQQNGQNTNRDHMHRGNSNARGNGQNRNLQNRQNRNDHTIRFVTGNPMGFPQPQMGFPQQIQQQQQQYPQPEQQLLQIPFH